MTTYVYEQVSLRPEKSGPCAVCGKPAKRSTTISNTINPFNRNEDGTVRTRAEVAENVLRLAKEWQAEPVMHAKCEADR